MLRFAELILEHGEELALLETLDVGKPIARSLSVDVPFCGVRWQARRRSRAGRGALFSFQFFRPTILSDP